MDSTASFTGLRGRLAKEWILSSRHAASLVGPKAVRSYDHMDWCEERAAECVRGPQESVLFTLNKNRTVPPNCVS